MWNIRDILFGAVTASESILFGAVTASESILSGAVTASESILFGTVTAPESMLSGAEGFRPIKQKKIRLLCASTATLSFPVLHVSILYTLNLNKITSPSFTTYSLPSRPTRPFSLAAAREPQSKRS